MMTQMTENLTGSEGYIQEQKKNLQNELFSLFVEVFFLYSM